MRFDSTVFTHVGESYPWDILMDEFRQTAKLLDEGGFSGIWIAEHHFAWDGWFRGATNPILLGADLATHAPNLRIGQCGVILPDWHPLRVAEDIAMLDNMTKGRVEFGIGRGINSRTSIQFNPDADRLDQKRNYALFTESLDVIIKAWTEEKFTYQGEFYTVPNPGWHEPNPANADPRYHATNGELTALGVEPKPYQQPHPPIWQMADSESSHKFAGERGINAMCFFHSVEKIRKAWATYRDAASKARGRELGFGEGLAIMRPTYVAPTVEEAKADVRMGVEQLGSWLTPDPLKVRRVVVTEEELRADDLTVDQLDFQVRHDLMLVGSPDSVSEQIERLRSELNCQHLALYLNFPGLSFEKTMRSLDLFAERVIPRFR